MFKIERKEKRKKKYLYGLDSAQWLEKIYDRVYDVPIGTFYERSKAWCAAVVCTAASQAKL